MLKIKLPSKRIKIHAGRSFGWLYFLLTIAVFALGVGLYFQNATFQKNINLALSFLTPKTTEKIQEGPQVSEKDGQAFILYDHPLVTVTIVKDSQCRGERCKFPNLEEEIQKQITPLVKIKNVDYRTKEGAEVLKNVKWTMLPVVIFDKTLALIRGFDQIQELFFKDGDNYLLRLQPSTTRILPKYENALMNGFVNKNYPVKIVEYANYTCYYCARSQEVINKLLEKYPDDIALYFKHFIRSGNDLLLARASECSAVQGKFWEMHKALFENQETFHSLEQGQYLSKLLELAYKVAMPDQVAFRECVKSDLYDKKIQKQIDEAKEIGVDSTPVFFINDAVIPGSMGFPEFDAVVRNFLGLPPEKN